jgi:hypothetical protein
VVGLGASCFVEAQAHAQTTPDDSFGVLSFDEVSPASPHELSDTGSLARSIRSAELRRGSRVQQSFSEALDPRHHSCAFFRLLPVPEVKQTQK